MNKGWMTKSHDGKRWYRNGKLHRTDGPAVEYTDSGQEWWLNGVKHREDGPAVICVEEDHEDPFDEDEDEENIPTFYRERRKRRICSPPSYSYEYWLSGVELTEKEFNLRRSI